MADGAAPTTAAAPTVTGSCPAWPGTTAPAPAGTGSNPPGDAGPLLRSATSTSVTVVKAVTTVPIATATKNIGTPLTAPSTATIGPPCGTASFTPASPATAPATAPPSMLAGITCAGRAAANGMAPSDIPKQPMNSAASPVSRSCSVYSRLRISVARPCPSGITGMAAAHMPITVWLPLAMSPAPNRNAVLLTGPPMSNEIISPRIRPSSTALVPVIPPSQLVRCSNTQEIGLPMT